MSADGRLAESWQPHLGGLLASAPMQSLAAFLLVLAFIIAGEVLQLALSLLVSWLVAALRAEGRGGDGPAYIDIESCPVPFVIKAGGAGQTGGYPALQVTPVHDSFPDPRLGHGCSKNEECRNHHADHPLHGSSPPHHYPGFPQAQAGGCHCLVYCTPYTEFSWTCNG